MPLLARCIGIDISLLDTLLQHFDDCRYDLPSYVSSEHAYFIKHEAGARREEFSGSSKTGYSKRALSEAVIRDANSSRIVIWITCGLA